MKTYADTQGQDSFDWNEFLDRAIAGEINNGELFQARSLASSWVTCACGNQCAEIPRHRSGEPKDGELTIIGEEFMKNVVCERWHLAKTTLSRIEERSEEILLEMKGKTR